MSGNFIIDSQDAYRKYGVLMTEGSCRSLLSWPSLKAVQGNEWHEEEGIEADLSAPALDTKNISLNFAVSNGTGGYEAFMEIFSGSVYHDFHVPELEKSWRLRMTAHPALESAGSSLYLGVSFADDFPLDGYVYAVPESSVISSDEYMLDNRKFTDYGVRILGGTLPGFMKTASVRPNLQRNIKSRNGVIYDGKGPVRLKAKDVSLNCLLRADSVSEMWRNYYALLYDLTLPWERKLYVRSLDSEYSCYYKSSAVSEFDVSGTVWMKFGITLCII